MKARGKIFLAKAHAGDPNPHDRATVPAAAIHFGNGR